MKLLLPLRIGRDEFDLVNLWSIVMGFWSTVFVHFSNALGTKRSDSCCAVIPAAGSQRSGSRAHGVLQVAGESIRLSRCLESFFPPPIYILIR